MGKVSKITPVTKQNIRKKHQNKATLSATHVFALAWSRNMFPAAKILMSTLGLLFQCCCLFCCRISHPKPPWASQSCLLQFQLTWTELGWSVTSPNISVLPSFWGWWHRERRGQEISSFLCQSSSFSGSWQCSGKENPKEDAEGFAGGSRQGPGDGAGTPPLLSLCVALTHIPSPGGLKV